MVETALDLVDQEGEAGIGFNRVARALGIKPPSLYSHVADHAELRRLVVARAWERFHGEARAASGRRRGAAALRAVAAAYRSFARRHPGLFRLMEAVSLGPADVTRVPVRAALLDLFATPLIALGAAPRDLIHHTRALRAAVHGFVTLEAHGQFELSEDVDESFSRLLTTLIRGIGAARPGRRPIPGG